MGGRTSLFAALARSWREPGRYDWLIQLVEANGYGRLTRYGVAMACLAIGAWPILLALSPERVPDMATRMVTVGCGVLALLFGCCWLLGWPTRRQSTFIVVVLNSGIAITCVAYTLAGRPVAGTLAFAITASYVACVHTLPQLVALLTLASAINVLGMVTVGMAGDPASGLADGLLRLASVTVVPMTVRTLVDLLGEAAVVSDIDPLTGLANRRGLTRAVRQLVGTVLADRPGRVCATMIDIDDFKSINDTRGHAAGDRVLVDLAETLRAVSPDESVIARIGGEEFAIVALCDTDGAVQVAENLRGALRAEPAEFTASFGVATIALPPRAAVDSIRLTERLLDVADRAMYLAKRAGGDRIEVADVRQ